MIGAEPVEEPERQRVRGQDHSTILPRLRLSAVADMPDSPPPDRAVHDNVRDRCNDARGSKGGDWQSGYSPDAAGGGQLPLDADEFPCALRLSTEVDLERRCPRRMCGMDAT